MRTILLFLLTLTLVSCASRRPASGTEVEQEQAQDVSEGINADFYNVR
jgi:hypothetical protein